MTNNPTNFNPPSAAVLTPRGRGAVATIRFHGDCHIIDDPTDALFSAANGKPLQDQPVGQVCFGHWGNATTEEVVVCRTDDRSVEIHCHGGDAAVRRIVDDLQSLGCEIQSWQDMTAGTSSSFESECAQALSRATTLRTAQILLQQQSGVLKSALKELQCSLASWNAKIRKDIKHKLDELLRWSNFGLHLTEPWKIVVAGRPNVGKSSLINALLGFARAIVFDQPGTTRDVVTAQTALDGWPIQLTDTAGIRQSAEPLESAGIELARQQLAGADCRVLLFDTSQPPEPDDWRLLSAWPDAILVGHKSDLPNVWDKQLPESATRMSSLTGERLDELAKALTTYLVPDVPDLDTPIPFTARQIELLKTARTAVENDNESACRTALNGFLS